MKTLILLWWSGISDHPILAICGGVLLYLLIRARKFHRRGLGGLDHHKSYISYLSVSLLEWIGKWVSIATIVVAFYFLMKSV